MGKGRTLIRGTLLLAASGLALRGIGVLFQTFLAGRIGAEGMGLLQLVLTVGGFAGTLASSGVRVAALQLTARAFGRGDRRAFSAAVTGCLRYALAVSCTVGCGLIALAGPISRHLLLEPRTARALRVMGLLLPFGSLYGVLRSSFTACGRVRELVAVELAERVLCVSVTCGLLRLAGSSPGRVCTAVILGSFGCTGLSFFLLHALLRRRLPERAAPLKREVTRLCGPLALNDYLRSGLGALEQFLIPYGLSRSGSRSEALAAYGTVSAMVFPVMMFPSEILFALSELMVSELSRTLAAGDDRRLRELVKRSLRDTVCFAAGIAALLYCCSDVLGSVLFHSSRVGYYLRIFSPMVLFLYLDAMVDGLQKGLGQQLYLVRCNSFTNVIDVVGLYTLLPGFGLAGYVFTYACSHLVNLFLSLRRLLLVAA